MKRLLVKYLKSVGLYHSLQLAYRSSFSFLSNQYYRVTYFSYRGSGFLCNYCGGFYRKFVPNYPSSQAVKSIIENNIIAGPGENVYCPNCMSKNRERLVKAVMENYLDIKGKSILHFAPEKHLFRFLKEHAFVTTADLTPGFYRNVDKKIMKEDITKLSFSNNFFDIIVANHILEHIPDDKTAMLELFRVLKYQGVAVLQVPLSETIPSTLEDPFINDPLKQEELYGQKDHVRVYAFHDYIDRLTNAGFCVKVIRPEMLSPYKVNAIQEGESVILAYK